MKYGDCIRCGFCCTNMPCGLGKTVDGLCEFLTKDAKGVYTCLHYPFTHLGPLTQLCLEAGKGCGYGGEHKTYEELWVKLKS